VTVVPSGLITHQPKDYNENVNPKTYRPKTYQEASAYFLGFKKIAVCSIFITRTRNLNISQFADRMEEHEFMDPAAPENP
jgi:hypothetical protein